MRPGSGSAPTRTTTTEENKKKKKRKGWKPLPAKLGFSVEKHHGTLQPETQSKVDKVIPPQDMCTLQTPRIPKRLIQSRNKRTCVRCPASLNSDSACRFGGFSKWHLGSSSCRTEPCRDTQSQNSLFSFPCFYLLSFTRQGKQQTCVDRNTRHIHPWSDVVGGRGSVRMGVHWRTEDGGGEGEESVDGVRWE